VKAIEQMFVSQASFLYVEERKARGSVSDRRRVPRTPAPGCDYFRAFFLTVFLTAFLTAFLMDFAFLSQLVGFTQDPHQKRREPGLHRTPAHTN